MQEFNDIQNLWKQTENKIPQKEFDFTKITSNRQKIEKELKKGIYLLIPTGIFVLALMFLLDEKLQRPAILVSMVIIAALCFFQVLFFYFNLQKIKKIDENATPELHLKQWQDYNEFRKKQLKWNLPVYYLILFGTLNIYMFELTKNGNLWYMILIFAATYFWAFYSYFFIGRKKMRKTDEQYNEIINDLKSLARQFQEAN